MRMMRMMRMMALVFLFNAMVGLPCDGWCKVERKPFAAKHSMQNQTKAGTIVNIEITRIEIRHHDVSRFYPILPGTQVVRQEQADPDTIREGAVVLVQGRNRADGSVMAIEVIRVSDAGTGPMAFQRSGNNEFARVLGKVLSVSPLTLTTPGGSGPVRVMTDGRTRFLEEREGNLTDLAVGDEVRVLGRKNVKLADKERQTQQRQAMEIPDPPLVGPSYYEPVLAIEKEASPFGFFDPNMLRFHHSLVYDEFPRTMNDLGAYWAAYGATFSFKWSLIEKKSGEETYEWDRMDQMVQISQNHNIHLIGYIKAGEPGEAHDASQRIIPSLPDDLDRYRKFVSAVVERYDGDGVGDMPGLVLPIKYWSIEDEPLAPIYFKGTGADYARLLLAGAEAIKTADPEAKVIVSMLRNTGWLEKAGDPRKFMLDFYEELAALTPLTPYDILDQHWLGADKKAGSADQFEIYESWIQDLESTAKSHGFQKVPLVNLELAGRADTETIQAQDLVKRHVFLLALKTGKILWSGLKAAPGEALNQKQVDNYFRKVTLIDGDGRKKIGYDTYKMMVDILDGSDWSQTRIVKKNENGVFVFQFVKNGYPFWVLWNDNGKGEQQLPMPSGIEEVEIISALPDTGTDGADFKNRFHRTARKVTVSEKTVRVDVDDTPVYVIPVTP